MDNNINKGQLKRWNDSKGFGFIKPESDSSDVFLHISALKGMSRRPKVGDTIFYNIQTDTDGKKRAFNARIDGAAKVQVQTLSPRRNSKKHSKSNWFIKLLFLVVLLVIIFSLYRYKMEQQTIAIDAFSSSISKRSNSNYTCSGKTYCSEMRSCEEAKFYLNSCPGTKLDGDRDGIPCESQWCR